MIKQRKVIANPKGKTISEVLGIEGKRAEHIAKFAEENFHKEKSYTKVMEMCRKESKTQEEFVWAIHNLGFTKGMHAGLEKAAKVTAHELTQGLLGRLFGGSNKNDSFWANLDAIMVVFLFIGVIVAVENFPHNWWIIPLDLFLLVLTFWRRLK